jgi:uncharacterized protein (TIGR02391 family)
MNESIDFFSNTCPLTGLPTEGRATVKPIGIINDVLYTFAPIGRASFTFQTATRLAHLIRQGDFRPRLDLAGLSRQAAEKGEPPLVITNEVFGAPRADVPNTFEEKRKHFLQLLYDAGGNEYRERTINTFEDFPMAFASDAEQFFRIVKSLLAEKLICYDESSVVHGDWVNGIQAHYHNVLLTATGRQTILNEPAIAKKQVQPLAPSLETLHPTVQKAAGKLFADAYYPQAILAACTALEKSIQTKSGQSASVTGTTLLGKAFPKDNPLIVLSADQGEREGYGFLYRGLLQAIRNHYAHNLTEIDPARALEWLSFISALFYKLDEAQPTMPITETYL